MLLEEGGAQARLALHSLFRNNNLTLCASFTNAASLPYVRDGIRKLLAECSHRLNETLSSFYSIATCKVRCLAPSPFFEPHVCESPEHVIHSSPHANSALFIGMGISVVAYDAAFSHVIPRSSCSSEKSLSTIISTAAMVGYPCGSCNASFRDHNAYTSHLRRFGHRAECETCPRTFRTLGACEQHMTDTDHWSEDYACDFCIDVFWTQADAKDHMKTFCHDCDRSFESEANYQAVSPATMVYLLDLQCVLI